jgi:murein DD-endopeptidase MepM/ murein hydrolase activator NlpD
MENLDKWLIKYKSLIFIAIIGAFIMTYVFIQFRPAFLKVKSTPEEIAELKFIVLSGFEMLNTRFDIQDSINRDNIKTMERIPKIFASPGSRISSNYGMRDSVMHWGIDIAQKKGNPIYAPISGRVIESKFVKGYGNLTIIDSGMFLAKIAHQDKMLVTLNQEVKQGEIIGTVGSTGISSGAHEHIEIIQNDNLKDPKIFIID